VVIEVKPKRLLNVEDNVLKFEAAEKSYPGKFRVITEDDVQRLSDNKIRELYNSGEIKFISRYDKLFRRKYIDESNKEENY